MTYTVRDWLAAAREQERELEDQLNELRQRRGKTERALDSVAQDVAQVGADLGELLLPELTAAALQQAVAWTGCPGLNADVLLNRLEAERTELRKELAELEASVKVRDFDALFGPGGSKRRRFEELDEVLAPMTRFVRRAAHERLDHLIDVGYGTAVYEVQWWRMSYYADWKAGDEVLEQVGGKYETFVDFLAEYMRVNNERQGLLNEFNDLRHAIEDAEAARRRKTAVGVKLGTLNEAHAQEARELLMTYVAGADASVFKGRLDDARQVSLAIKRWRGLEAKHLYLDRLREVRLDRREQDLSLQLAKVRRKMVKYRRPKHAYTRFGELEFRRTFKDRSGKYSKYWRKFDRDYGLVYEFDDYDCWHYEEEFLWWDVMVDGRYDGAWIPEVQEWRGEHPGYVYERSSYERDEEFDDEDAAAAVAAADFEDRDEALGFDAS